MYRGRSHLFSGDKAKIGVSSVLGGSGRAHGDWPGLWICSLEVGRKGEEGRRVEDEACESSEADVDAALDRTEAVSKGSLVSSVEEREGRRRRGWKLCLDAIVKGNAKG